MKKIKITKLNILVVILLIILLIILIPVILDNMIIGNNIPSNISNNQWISFFGSYIGSILAGLISIIGVLMTIRYYKEQDINNRKEREKGVLRQIKKQHEINYRFEYLNELEKINVTITIISEMFSNIVMVVYDSKQEKPLSIISYGYWKEFHRLADDLYKHYNNLKSIYECKLSVFYKNSFIKNIDNEIDGLIMLLYEELNKSCMDKTIEQFEQDLYFLIMQWEIEKQLNTIKDINEWIKTLKNRFFDHMSEFKKTI